MCVLVCTCMWEREMYGRDVNMDLASKHEKKKIECFLVYPKLMKQETKIINIYENIFRFIYR